MTSTSAPVPFAPAKPLRRASFQWAAALSFMVLLAISEYDPTSFLLRGTRIISGLNWFWRFRFAGVFTFFDLFLLALASLLAAQSIFAGRVRRSAFDRTIVIMLIVVAGGTISGFMKRGEQDTMTDLLFQLRNYYYLTLVYIVSSRLDWTERRYRQMAHLVVGLAAVVILLGIWETSQIDIQYRLSKYGRLTIARDATDGVYILFAQLFFLALWCENIPRPPAHRVVLGLINVYVLYAVFTSVSKTMVLLFPVGLAYLAWFYRLYRKPWFVPVVAAFGLSALVFLLMFTNIGRIVSDPTSALYVYSTFVNAEDYSTATRLNQILNFVPNMLDRGAVLQGIGLGSKWHEYIPQFPEDAAAYPPWEMGTKWHLAVHVPLLRILMDFGLVGATVLLFAFYRMFRKSVRALRAEWFAPATRACVQPALMLIVYQITVNNLNVPKTNLFAGFLLGATSGLVTHGALRARGS